MLSSFYKFHYTHIYVNHIVLKKHFVAKKKSSLHAKTILLQTSITISFQVFKVIKEFHPTGMTALHIAVKNGFLNIARILIKELGCDVNDEDRVSGNTCLHVLMESEGSLDMLRYLLKHDADPNITNFSGLVRI